MLLCLTDPNEGTELKFIPSSIINGVKCTNLVKSDVEVEIQYWQSAVLCTVIGANPPFEVMKGFLKCIWETMQLIDKILVEKCGIYFFDSKPMLVKGWNPTMDLQTKTIRSLPIWIHLPALDIKYWGMESLSKIGSILGIPFKTDKFTKDKQVIRYARLLVEMQIDGPFPEHIEFFNEEGVLTHQQVTYEWIPSKCTHCAMLGHTEEVCKKKGVAHTEWRRIVNPKAPSQPVINQQPDEQIIINLDPQQSGATIPSTQQPTAGSSQNNMVPAPSRPRVASSQEKPSEAFITVSKGASPKRPTTASTDSLSMHQNSFRRIWVAWKPCSYSLTFLEKIDQLIHCEATQLSTSKYFHITFIYGHNLEFQRQPLWEDLHHISLSVPGAWCILGDFNSILYKDDRIGGNEVIDRDTQELSAFMETCEVQEMTGSGASKIDRVFINSMWHEEFDYTMVNALPPGLLDHSPLLIQFHVPPRPPPQFLNRDMWSSHKEFQNIVAACLPIINRHTIMRQAKHFFYQMRHQLSRLNRDHFKDLKT
ncbi:LOW QUALITY PROTEIN: hypothetical protein Cgig2_031131 [Carnegiea gigantea]|uniref:DUF4283 domain-containing protein n=1 Tax=Carnegiea gigantea TaxID=171969 RepID=A0A9Q1JF27_9CARY|nr:LOW QUALITY PROTEIN: hypothetical protein Cgig2_031131 [Carnegiea gigantea]